MTDYTLKNAPTEARKAYGEAFREALLNALPSTVPSLAKQFKRSRTAILYHINQIPGVEIDPRTYPHTIRRAE